ncbi:MAG: glucose-1-phosphate adenylyltransferase subunit GlgD [Lachnospiraceae bacterium]|nr:glucose-1-phosphate adenylyltransferase subunit GlgD [Lachnospiraceae bacterium]
MARALGIISFSENHIWVEGLETYRSIPAFSFLGRYRVVDFPISNMSNSGIDRIQVYVRRKPCSLVEHIGTGRHYNINSKSGYLQMVFADSQEDKDYYNTDIKAYAENLDRMVKASNSHVVIAPGYMVYTQDFDELLRAHEESGADVTLLYHKVDNAKDAFLSCDYLNLNKQKGVESIERNNGTTKTRSIFMDTYVMKKEIFMDLIQAAQKASSMYTMKHIINDMCGELDIRGVAHKGFFAPIDDLKGYFDANLSLLDPKNVKSLFNDEWPIYTRTSDSCPTQYYEAADVKTSFISNGCQIEGKVENSVIGRGCVIKPGAVVKNCVVLADTVIGNDVHIENQVVDRLAKVTRMKEIIADPTKPGYVKRNDIV